MFDLYQIASLQLAIQEIVKHRILYDFGKEPEEIYVEHVAEACFDVSVRMPASTGEMVIRFQLN